MHVRGSQKALVPQTRQMGTDYLPSAECVDLRQGVDHAGYMEAVAVKVFSHRNDSDWLLELGTASHEVEEVLSKGKMVHWGTV